MEAEEDADERRLAGPVRSEHGEELASFEREVEPREEPAAAEPEAETVGGDDRRHRASAACSARTCASCQAWKVVFAGSVSLSATTGTPLARAALRTRAVIGETAWRL